MGGRHESQRSFARADERTSCFSLVDFLLLSFLDLAGDAVDVPPNLVALVVPLTTMVGEEQEGKLGGEGGC